MSGKISMRIPNEGEDNTYGRGHVPLPPKLRRLPIFADAFMAPLKHRVFFNGDAPTTHMLTVKVPRLSIMRQDMISLMKLGLVRVMSNDPNEISFYFDVKEDVGVLGSDMGRLKKLADAEFVSHTR